MWDNLGKVKTKRTKPTKPYERPKSILRQVTDSVTGLLPQPSWLVNWLHPSASKDSGESSGKEDEEPVPSTSSSTGSRNVNSSQESTRESFIFQRPPGSLKDQGNGSAPFDLPPARSNLEPASLPPAREVSVQTVNGDDDSHSESTSGCSSLLPHPEHRNREAQDVEPLNIDSSSLQMLRASLSKSFASEMKSNNRPSRKTLSLHPYSHDSSQTAATGNVDSSYNDLEGPSGASFYSKDEMSSTLNQSASKRSILPQPSALNSKRPRFNATMFGPVVMGARRSFLNDTSIADSPFYAGRTTYGGASAYRRASIQPTLTPYPDARKRLQARPSSICSAPPTPTGATAASSGSSATSSAAPHVVLSSSAQKILHALEAMSTPVTDAKRIPTTSRRSSSASLQEEEPSFTGYGLSRRRPQLGPPTAKLSMGRPAIVVSRAPTSVSTSTVGTSVLAASTPISSQAGGKMRSRVSATARESIRTVKGNEELPETDLPAVALPVSNLPSFSLLPPPPTTSTAVAPPQPSSLLKSTASPVKPSAPSIPGTPAFNGHRAAKEKTEARPTFTFAAPLVTVSPSAAAAAAVAAKTSKSLTFSFSSPLYVRPAATEELNVEEKKPMEIGTDFPPSPVKPTSELKSGSVMDILRKEAPSKADTPKTSTTTSVAPVGLAPVTASVGFGDKFKPPTESWTCSVCCITNSKDKTICAACETPNPKAQNAAPTPAPAAPVAPTSFSGFGDKFKMSSTQWECDTCMVRNLECDTQCKSCETPRPGSAKATAAAKPVSTFKFGVPAPSQEKAALPTSVSAASSTPSSGFTFGTVADRTDSKKEETSTGGFKFGAAVTVEPAKKSDETPAGGFKFGASIETPTAAPAAVPAAPKTEVSTGGFKFGSSLASAPPAEASGFKFGASAPAVQPSSTPSVDTAKKTEPQTSTAPAGALQFGVGSTLQFSVDSTKKTESALGKLLDTPASTAPSSFGGFGLATTVTTASKTMPVLSFGAAPVQPSKSTESFEGIKPATELKTGSVLDFLSKKPSLPVSTEASSASSLSFSQPPKAAPAGMFAFGKPAETSTGTAAPFSFNGPLTSAAGGSTATDEQPTAKKTTFELPAAPTTAAAAPSTFSFGATSTPSLSLFKPATTTGATSMFGFGQPSAAATTTSAPSFTGTAVSTTTTSAPAPSLFTFGATAATPAATTSTTTAPATSSAGIFTFGQSAATSASTFPFGAPSAAAPATAAAPAPAAAPVAPSLFQFGKTEPAKSSPFSFGGPAATSAPATSTTATPFTFGAAAAAAAPATTQADASKSVFAFGSSASQPTATTAAPAFGTFSAPTQTPFGFGAAKTEPFGAPSAPAAPSSTPFGTGFGSAASTPAAASFGFGSPAQPATAPMFNPTPSFNFGSTATPSAAAPAASAPAANPGIFTFGSTSSMPAMSQGFGTFNAPSFAPTNEPPAFGAGFGGNPFDVSASAASSGRKIRKAVRRR